MAIAYPFTITGATAALTSSTYDSTPNAWQITGINWSGISRGFTEAPHINMTAAGAGKFGNMPAFLHKACRPGQVTLNMYLIGSVRPPIEDAADTLTITLAGASATTAWAGTGGVVEFSWEGSDEGMVTATLVWQFTGEITVTPGA